MADWWQGLNVSPYWPNMDDPIELEYEFDTWINLSRSGQEQRIANRPYARVSISFASWLRDGRLGNVNALRQAPHEKAVVPYGYRGKTLLGSYEEGDTVLQFAGTLPSWMIEGETVILHSRYADEQVTLGAIGSGTILVTGLEFDHQGPARLARMATVYPDARKERNLIFRNFQTASKARFLVDPREPILPVSDEYTIMRGFEVWQVRPNFESTPKVNAEPFLEIVESRGVLEVYSPHEWQGYSREQKHLLKTADEIDEFIDFFLRHKGRQKSFYARNYDPFIEATNATPSTYAGPGPRQFTANTPQLYEDFHPHGNDRRIFEAAAPFGTPALNIRIPPGPGERVIATTPTQAVTPQNNARWTTPQIILTEDGPGEKHIDSGLVYCNMFVSAEGHFHSDAGPYEAGSAAAMQLECRVGFDRKTTPVQTPNDIQRWEQVGGLWQRKAGTLATTGGLHEFSNTASTTTGSGPTTATAQLSCLVPVGARFFRYILNYLPLPFVSQTYTLLGAYINFTWGAPADPEEYLELFNPVIGAEAGAKIEGYSLYRFDNDRLTVVQRSEEVAEATIQLRAIIDSEV